MPDTPTTRMSKDHVTQLRSRTRVRTLHDRYELRRVIGEGGMAEVYLGTDLVMERDVAVKLLRRNLALQPEYVERFRREALALASIDSPHVVPAYDVGVDGEDHYLVMRYVRGQSLAARIAQRGTIEPARALRLIADVLAGLHALHNKNLIHRDIKSENVLVDWDDRAAIVDLGVAMDRARPQLTDPSTTVGTVSLMPPEQRQTGHVDVRTDTYQAGLLLLHMLTGNAVDAGDQANLEAQLAIIPPGIAAVLRRALDHDIERRWSTAPEMAQALLAARTTAPAPVAAPVVSLPVVATPLPPPVEAAPAPMPRGGLLVRLSLAAIAGAAVTAAATALFTIALV